MQPPSIGCIECRDIGGGTARYSAHGLAA
jgi:hypothetical protein